MPANSPEVIVGNGEREPGRGSGPPERGTASLLQGVLTLLSEELHRLNKRLGALEGNIAERLGKLEGALEAAKSREAGTADALGALLRRLDALDARRAEAHDQSHSTTAAVAEQIEAAMSSLLAAVEDRDRLLPMAMSAVSDRVSERLGALEQLIRQTASGHEDVTDSLQAAVARLDSRLGALERATEEARAGAERAGQRVDDLGPAIEEMGGYLRGVDAALARLYEQADARSDARSQELQALLDTGVQRLVARAGESDKLSSSELRAVRVRLEELFTAVTGAGSAQAVRETLDTLAGESRQGLRELHSSLSRRLDARTQTLVEAMESMVDCQAGHEPVLEAVRALESSLERSLDSLRGYLGDGLVHVNKRQAGVGKGVERVLAAVAQEQNQVQSLLALCQSTAAAAEQQGAVGARVADLVLESRAALRGEVAAVAAALDTLRTLLHAHVEDTARRLGPDRALPA